MTFTFSRGSVLVSIFLCFFANAVYASEKFTGASLKKEIISHAHQVGITLKPIISEHKVFYPCHEGLSIGPKFDSWETVEVSCKLPYAWKLVVRSKVFSGQSNSKTDDLGEKETFNYVVFDKPVKKGTILTKDSLIQMANFSAWGLEHFQTKTNSLAENSHNLCLRAFQFWHAILHSPMQLKKTPSLILFYRVQ